MVLELNGRFVCMCRNFCFGSNLCVNFGGLDKLCLSLCWG